MNEKELIKKLNSFQNIKLDSDYKTEARGILYNQISSSTDNFIINNIALSQRVFEYIAQPIWAVFFVIIIIGSGIFSFGASQYMNPGDSLYIAKLISNKAQLAITFNTDKKTKLGIQFANDYAKDITKVLASGEMQEDGQEVVKLSEDFKRHISTARAKLQEIKVVEANKIEENKEGEEVAVSNDDNNQIFSANLGRDDNGVQVSDPSNNNVVSEEEDEEVQDVNKNEEVASSTNEVESIETKDNGIDAADKMLEEAESLFNEKDYSGTLNKLDEAGILINGVTEDEGEVKGVNETASSTEVVD